MKAVRISITPEGASLENVLGMATFRGLAPGTAISKADFEDILRELKGEVAGAIELPVTVTVDEAGVARTAYIDGRIKAHPALDWQQISFVQGKCLELGSFEAVKRFYSDRSHVDTYGRNFAKVHYEVAEAQEDYTPAEKWAETESKPKQRSARRKKAKELVVE